LEAEAKATEEKAAFEKVDAQKVRDALNATNITV
jgi:hypothetical protein